MSKLLYVVHRYAPFPGGSEYYVQNMAEESLLRGHKVTVLAHEHQGDLTGVKVTNDYQILGLEWDLIIVHGGDVISQNIVHVNAYNIKSPVLYMIIKPSDSIACRHGLKYHEFLGYSTSMDIDHIKSHGQISKARRVRHGVVAQDTIIQDPLFKDKKNIYVSAGGFYPHKAMIPLAEAFEKSNLPGELHLYGYGQGPMPAQSARVKTFFGKTKKEVLMAIASANAYIMNSYEEGFGLVLLESMLNKTPWYARNIAGAKDMSKYGRTYETESKLMAMLAEPQLDFIDNNPYNYAMANHTIVQTVNDIEDIIFEAQ